jgi:CO/xanthine dehydrogenase Mo-binding subunit
MLAGQIEGGIGQGISGALFEEFRYDAEGQLLTGSFQDYLLATAAETPPITHFCLQDSPSLLNPLGVKGAGEIGIAGIGGAVANAVADALGEYGHRVSRLPLTPERVWTWLSEACSGQGEVK